MKHLFVTIMLSLITGCAAMEKEAQDRFCNQEGAYQQGVNDAQGGQNMRADWLAYQCPSEQKIVVKKYYIDGYMTIKNKPIININNNNNTYGQSCLAKPGHESFQAVCSALGASICNLNSSCIYR